jgi:hypothetical protein
MTKVCPRCHHMVREPADSGSLSCPRCIQNGRAVPLLNAVPVQRPVADRATAVGAR